MDFKQKVHEAISAGLGRISYERHQDEDFKAKWEAARESLFQVLREIAAAVQEAGQDVSAAPKQSGEATFFRLELIASENRARTHYELRFSPDPKERKIVCSTKPEEVWPEGGGSYTVDELLSTALVKDGKGSATVEEDVTRVRERVLRFIEAALDYEAKKRPSPAGSYASIS